MDRMTGGNKRLLSRIDRLEYVAETLDALVSLLDRKARERSAKTTTRESGRYPCIPYSRTVFVQLLLNVKRLIGADMQRPSRCAHCGSELTHKPAFVDVGCGVADKVALANHIGFEGHGIEVDSELVQVALRNYDCQLVDAHRCTPAPPARAWTDGVLTIYEADALLFDYSGFDVIFFYRPLLNERLQKQLERRIWRQARPGAFVICCNAVTVPPATFAPVTDWDGYEPPGRCAVYRRSRPRGVPGTPRKPGKKTAAA